MTSHIWRIYAFTPEKKIWKELIKYFQKNFSMHLPMRQKYFSCKRIIFQNPFFIRVTSFMNDPFWKFKMNWWRPSIWRALIDCRHKWSTDSNIDIFIMEEIEIIRAAHFHGKWHAILHYLQHSWRVGLILVEKWMKKRNIRFSRFTLFTLEAIFMLCEKPLK